MIKKVIIINPINAGRETFRPPFGLLIIASIFHKRGVEVKWIDADVLRNDKKTIYIETEKHLDADLIAIGGLHTAYGYIKEFFEYLRTEKVNIPTLIGGRVAKTLDYLIWNKIPNVDMISKQEGEYVVESICDNFPDMGSILGIEYRKNGKIIKNDPAPVVKSLDELPPKRWDFLDKDAYFGKGVGYVLTSIGCPYTCKFCKYPDPLSDKYRVMSSGRIVEEIEFLMTAYNVRTIDLVDENFMLNKKRVEEFCDAVKQKNVRWICNNRADGIKEEDLWLLKKMGDAGCRCIKIGIESGCQEILDKMNKKLKIKQVETAIDVIRHADIDIVPTFIFGYPGETRETAMESVEWRLKMRFRGRYFYATPYPGAPLYDYFKDRYSLTLDDEEEWIIKSPSIKKLAFNLTDMSIEELNKLDRECRKKVKIPMVRKIATKLIGVLGKVIPSKQKVWMRKYFRKVYI